MSEVWAWIGGWGVSPEDFQAAAEAAFPDFMHAVYEPGPGAVDAVAGLDAARIGGYSLGSLLLLAAPDRVPWDAPLYCLAPVVGFCSEMKKGGTTSRATLAQIESRLESEPARALRLFHRLAGLRGGPPDDLPYAAEALRWGLRALAEVEAAPPPHRRLTAVIGRNDRLLNSDEMQRAFPDATLAYCGHDYRDLMQAIE